jgi:hypothetical protein
VSGEGNALNTTSTRPPTLEVRGRTVVTIFMPFARASGGRSDAKIRAVFPPRTNGLKLIEAEVRWRVIIVGVVVFLVVWWKGNLEPHGTGWIYCYSIYNTNTTNASNTYRHYYCELQFPALRIVDP